MTKQPAVYIVANGRNGTVYVGVTSDLVKRIHQHRKGALPGFASQYGCTALVYYELHADMLAAIAREKQIKGGSRARKLAVIEAACRQNPVIASVTNQSRKHRAAPLDCFVAKRLLAMTVLFHPWGSAAGRCNPETPTAPTSA